MKIQLLSDVHVEIYHYTPEVLPVDLVVLAGDIHTKGRGIAWAVDHFAVPVLYVPGNHEYYQGHLTKSLAKLREEAGKTNGQVQILERDVVEISGVRFIGATGWTDFSVTGNRSIAALEADATMNDYQKIRATTKYRKLRAADTMRIAEETACWLGEQIDIPFPGKTVVITHHAPSMASIPPWLRVEKGHHVAAYANRWEHLLDGTKVALWMHGHVHRAADYEVAGTRVVCNPRGYGDRFGGQALVNEFDPWMVIDV